MTTIVPMLVPALITAAFSAMITLGVGYLLFAAFLKKRIYAEIYAELEELSDVIKEKLREGVLEAGTELMPEFREEVRDGFKEALTAVASGDIIEQTARNMAKNSQTIVEQGLGMLLGRPLSGKEARRDSAGPTDEKRS